MLGGEESDRKGYPEKFGYLYKYKSGLVTQRVTGSNSVLAMNFFAIFPLSKIHLSVFCIHLLTKLNEISSLLTDYVLLSHLE